jgi:7-cyano-7-deazaguanine reductase
MRMYEKNLGKTTQYQQAYHPKLLDGLPRAAGRDTLDGMTATLFDGFDLWTAFEVSWLDLRGKPMVAMAELSIPCQSPRFVESKSMKLYFNSLNDHAFADAAAVQATLIRDLSTCVGAEVTVRLLPVTTPNWQDNSDFILLDDQPITIDTYDYSPALLAKSTTPEQAPVQERVCSHLLKSNCLVTNQPDWGSVYIDYHGAPIDHAALLRYIVSFRHHQEFHEQCVERIFCDIKRWCQPTGLTVMARYTRRGGLDINPYRTDQTAPLSVARLARQ